MLGLGRILISDLVVTNLLMYSLPVMILLYLAMPFFYTKGVLDEMAYTHMPSFVGKVHAVLHILNVAMSDHELYK